MELIIEGRIRDELTGEVFVRISGYTLEEFEEELSKFSVFLDREEEDKIKSPK